jgi:LmbE family N-acetylglucosaminyl deacetylase
LTEERVILCVFAHPDDESFMAAGTACRYSEEGVRVALVTATLGEEGGAGDPPVCTREELPAVREAELRRAADILGIASVDLLGYRDKQLAAAPHAEVREKLVGLIRRHRPQVVITFDPNGSNAHADHVAVSRFTSDAVQAATDARFFPEAGPAHEVGRLLWTTPTPCWELGLGEDPAGEPGVDFLLDVSQWRGRKEAALRAHRSQAKNTARHFFDPPDRERRLSVEAFRLAWGPRPDGAPADDIWQRATDTPPEPLAGGRP